MSDFKYDYIVAGRWRDHSKIRTIVDAMTAARKTVYCFVDNEYDGDGIKQTKAPDSSQLTYNHIEDVADWKTNPTLRSMFERDMDGIRDAREFIVVMPAGLSAHMELGVAYGMGKRCFAIGEPEKIETLYLMLDQIFPDVESFLAAQTGDDPHE